MMKKTEVTIKDVATKANVSISTVSRVLNGLDRVSPKTKEKVEAAAQELQFVPNNIAISMVTKRTNMIAVVVPEIINTFYISVIQGIENIAKQHGYHILMFSADNCAQTEMDMASSVFQRMADGIIVIPTVRDLSIYNHFGDRIVLVDRYFPGLSQNAVVVDNYGGSYMMGNYLVGKGHTRIGFVNGEETFNIGQERRAGFYTALAQNGIAADPELMFSGEWDESCGYQAMEQYFAMKNPPTAVFCTNNRICAGAIQYFSEHNLTIGEQISLVGFDDNKLARFVKPAVTVIDRPTIEMGESAMRILLSKLSGKGKKEPAAVTSMRVKIIERGSVKDLSVH